MIWRFNFTSYGFNYMDLILLHMDLILLHMKNVAAIYPLHFGNSNFCKSMPLGILYMILLKTPIYNILRLFSPPAVYN